eukprot:jgi/Chrzof1/13692/Cz08g08110.t1
MGMTNEATSCCSVSPGMKTTSKADKFPTLLLDGVRCRLVPMPCCSAYVALSALADHGTTGIRRCHTYAIHQHFDKHTFLGLLAKIKCSICSNQFDS